MLVQQFVNSIIPLIILCMRVKKCFLDEEMWYLALIFVGTSVYFDGWSWDVELIEESQQGFLCSTKSHMTRNCNQTAICEASDSSSTVWCLLWMSGTQRYQIWCKWGFCLGNFANFFLRSGFWLCFCLLVWE